MSETEQRIAIAEACPEILRWNGISHRVEWVDTDEETDPLDDLNACHEMEGVGLVTQNEFVAYTGYLAITGDPITATAAQRAEAFLKVKDLWK